MRINANRARPPNCPNHTQLQDHASNKMELNDRLSLVFGSLNTRLKSVNDPPLKEEERIEQLECEERIKTSGRHQQIRGRRSRDAPPSRGSKVPDYLKNPNKWTKYDLVDDGTSHRAGYEGLNDDQVNRKAALDFIHSLRQHKAPPTETGRHNDSSDGKITFKRPSRVKRTASPQSFNESLKVPKIENRKDEIPIPLSSNPHDHDKRTLSAQHNPSLSSNESESGRGQYEGTVLKMPEYFVSLSKKPKPVKPLPLQSAKTPAAAAVAPSIHLSHLEEDEED